MGFNEKCARAYIAAKFYAYLTEAFGERGKDGVYPSPPSITRSSAGAERSEAGRSGIR